MGKRVNAAEEALERRSCWYCRNLVSQDGRGARGKQCRS